MAIDVLQEKIRKLKNPSMIDLEFSFTDLPARFALMDPAEAVGSYCQALLEGLRGIVPAVRVSFAMFALLGAGGCEQLKKTLETASRLGYYVLLDSPAFATPQAAQLAASSIFDAEWWPCDAVTVPVYMGSEGIKPFLTGCRKKKKDLFVMAKTSNKTAPEMQDLITGSRLVHTAAMDLVVRHGGSMVGRCDYSQVGAIVGAGAPEAIRILREKYPKVFFLCDGYDYPSGNAKNCSFAFDQIGHGAMACAGASVTLAWKQTEGSDGENFVELAVEAAERMKKNLTRYVAIL